MNTGISLAQETSNLLGLVTQTNANADAGQEADAGNPNTGDEGDNTNVNGNAGNGDAGDGQGGGEGDNTDGNGQSSSQQEGEEDSSEDDITTALKTAFGVDALELNFNTVEDLANSIKAQVDAIKGSSIVENNPELQELHSFIEKGGTIEEFTARPVLLDFDAVVINEADVELQTTYVTEDLKHNKGLDDDAIEAVVNALKDSGRLFSTSLKAKETFKAQNAKEVENYDKVIADKQAAKDAERAAKWNEVNTVLTNGFKEFNIPKTALADFTKFVTPDANGVSLALEARKALSTEQILALDYVLFTKFKGIFPGTQQQTPPKVQVKGVIGKKVTASANTLATQEKTLSVLANLEKTFGKSN